MARIFGEFDATELPSLVGVRHRCLFVLGDLYVHLIETDDDPATSVAGVREHPLFVEISRRLQPYITPYDPRTWRSPADAMARLFYEWEPPNE